MLLQYKLSRPGGQFAPECPGQIARITWSICPGMTRRFDPEVGRFTNVTWSVCPGIPGQASRNALVKYQRNTFPCCRGTSGQFQRYTQADLDFAVLPVGDGLTMGFEDALIASDYVNTSTVVGVHYDTFGFIKMDHAAAIETFASAGKKLLLLDVGAIIDL